MKIPKIAHRIWFGEPFPEKYKNYLRQLAALNPDYVIKLWSDPHTMSEAAYLALQAFCDDIHVQLHNIRDHHTLINYPLFIDELNASKEDKTHQRLHYVKASDIARIGILYQEGGIYTDTDSNLTAPFPELDPESGMVLKLSPGRSLTIDPYFNYFQINDPQQKYSYFFSEVLYDFIASCRQLPALKLTTEITELDYKTYQLSKHRQWERSSNATHLLWGTVKLTGTSLKWALNYLHQTGAIDDPPTLFIDSEQFMEGDFDKSWLQGFESSTSETPSEYNDIDSFLKEIDSTRQTVFPITHHGEHPGIKRHYEYLNQRHVYVVPQQLTNPISFDFLNSGHPSSSSDILKLLQRDYREYPAGFQPAIELPVLTLPRFQIDTDQFRHSLHTPESIKALYKKNGGGILATFSIFHWHSHQTSSDIIKTLEMRAASAGKEDGASRKTLTALGL